jgi:hypothetical protein
LAYRCAKAAAAVEHILRLLEGSRYDAQDIGIMTLTHRQALRLCGVTDRASPAVEFIARRVVSKFAEGERDSAVIARAAAREFKESG